MLGHATPAQVVFIYPAFAKLAVEALRDALWASEGADYPAQLAADAAARAATRYAEWVRADARSAQPLRERIEAQGCFWGCIPEFEIDVHDLSGLGRVADRIAGKDEEL